jgi:hypothetical protein
VEEGKSALARALEKSDRVNCGASAGKARAKQEGEAL